MAILTGEKLFDEIVSSQLDLTLSAQASGRLINRLDGLINEEGNVSPAAVARLLSGNSNIKEAIENKNDSGEADSVFFQTLITTTRDDILDEGDGGENGEGENGDDDLSQLKDALLALDVTQADKDQFLVDALENDAVKDAAITRDPLAETAIDADITTVLNDVIDDMKGANGVDYANFGALSAQDQDSLIDIATAQKMGVLNTAVAAAGPNSATLLTTVTDKIEAFDAAAEAKTEAANGMTDAITGFDTNNPGTYVPSATPLAGEVFVDGNQLMQYVDGTNDIVLAEKDGNVWTLTDEVDGALAILSTTNLLDAYEAEQSADDALDAAQGALEDAVADVYLAELGDDAYSVYLPSLVAGGVITYNLDGSVADVDFTQTAAVFATKALADADAAGVQQVFTLEIGAAGTDGQTFIFDGYTYTVSGGNDASANETASNIQDEYAVHVGANWTVEVAGDTLTFVAKESAANAPDKFGLGITGDIGDLPGTVLDVTTPGIEPNVGTGTIPKDAPLSQAVFNEQDAVDAFDALKEDFLTARDLNDQLDDHNQAIDSAKAWFTDNDLVLPVSLVDGVLQTATDDGDIYMATSLEGKQSVSIDKFGEKGLDHLFVGDDLVRVDLPEDKDITDKIGESTVLEVFFKQVGDDLKVYIETDEIGGSMTGAISADELVTITLTGVNADDVDLVDGFIIAGE